MSFAFFIDIGDSSHQWTQNDLGMIFEEINLKSKFSHLSLVNQEYQLRNYYKHFINRASYLFILVLRIHKGSKIYNSIFLSSSQNDGKIVLELNNFVDLTMFSFS